MLTRPCPSIIRSDGLMKLWEKRIVKQKKAILKDDPVRYRWNSNGRWTTWGHLPGPWMEKQLCMVAGWSLETVNAFKQKDKTSISKIFHFLHQTAKGLALCPGFHQEGCVDLFCEMTRVELKSSIAKFVADVGSSDEVDWATHGSCQLVQEDDGFFVERKFPDGVKVPN